MSSQPISKDETPEHEDQLRSEQRLLRLHAQYHEATETGSASDIQALYEAIQAEHRLRREKMWDPPLPPAGGKGGPRIPRCPEISVESFMRKFKMTQEQADAISDPTWIHPGLIADGHIVAVVAKPNGGKTTILFHLACEWAQNTDRTVVFVHADTNPSDAKRMLQIAQRHGVNYLTPDLMLGQSMRDVVEDLRKLAASEVDLRGHIWLFDTLKKMTNVIQKEGLRNLLQLLRKLCMKGMTCILLAHTNKYKNDEGEYQYEGTGDLEADVDELIYFEPRENQDGSLTVSTRCTKRRAEISPMTWTVHKDRSVTEQDDYVDVLAEQQEQEQRERDAPVIEAVTELLAAGAKKQTEVISYCRELKFSEKRVRTTLQRYSGVLWRAQKLFEKNAWQYELLPNSGPKSLRAVEF